MIAVLFGPPGSGKGTQAGSIAKRLGIPHVSTGEMFRAEIAAQSDLGKQVGPIMASGSLVPDELTVRILEARLGQDDAVEGALLDGFPRTVPQAAALDEMLNAHGRRVDVVINLEVAEDELWFRISKRAATDGRSDDNEQAFKHRMDVYREQTAPVLDFYRNSSVRVEDIDGYGDINDVTGRIVQALNGDAVAP